MPTKTVTVKVKTAGESGDSTSEATLTEGQFTAYASIFGNVDAYGEVVDKGAFANTLDEWAAKDAPIPVYWAHQMSNPAMNLGSVLEAKEDDKGLLVKAQLDIAGNPTASYVYELLKAKRVDQMSFAFDVLGAKAGEDPQDNESDAVHLTELKLHEVSVVPIGANQETEVLDVKQLSSLEIRGAGGVGRGDDPSTLAPTVKAGRVLSAKNENKIKSAISALQEVLADLSSDSGDDGKSVAPAQISAARAALATLEGN